MDSTDRPLCSFTSSALPLEPLLVLDWHGEEAISRPYRFDVSLASRNPLLDDEAMLGQSACLSLFDAMGLPHPYHGVISEVEQLDSDDQYFYFRVVLEPRMALLRQQRFSEIWLDKSLPELIRAVLFDVDLLRMGPGIGGDSDAEGYDFDIRLTLDDLAHKSVNFTCQFEETSFDFLSRMLEYYGVYYFFEQQVDHEALILCGDLRFQPLVPIALTYFPMHSTLEAAETLSVVRSFRRHRSSQSRTVVLQGFSASAAQLQLQTSALVSDASLPATADAEHRAAVQSSPAFRGEFGLYGEHLGSNKEGIWLATRRAQAIGCRHREFHGSGSATGVRAGYPMQLLKHQRLTLNVGYQVIEVRHDGSQPLPGLGDDKLGKNGSSSTSFIALPGDIQFRAPCITPRPNVQGLLSAVIDGDDNTTQPLLNEYGCYKVIFPFIRSDKAKTRGSAWLRMATMSSGANHGMHFPLLKGSEVLVSFIGGDPDRPIITGSVPNSENPNIVNSNNATQSGLMSPGGNYLAIDDHAVNSRVRLGAPAGNTSLTLGQNGTTGAHLSTDSHMQFRSSSFTHQVPGLYSKTVSAGDDGIGSGSQNSTANAEGSGATPATKAATAAAPASDASEFKTKPFSQALSGTGVSESASLTGFAMSGKVAGLSVELNVVGVQASASINAAKFEFSAVGLTVSAKLSGYVYELGLNKATYKYENMKKFLAAVDAGLSAHKRHESIVQTTKSVVTRNQSEFIESDALTLIDQNVEGSGIAIGLGGVLIKAGGVVVIEGDVIVQGSLFVNGSISSDGGIQSVVGFATPGLVNANIIEAVKISAGPSDFAVPTEPAEPDPALEVNIALAEALVTQLVAARGARESIVTPHEVIMGETDALEPDAADESAEESEAGSEGGDDADDEADDDSDTESESDSEGGDDADDEADDDADTESESDSEGGDDADDDADDDSDTESESDSEGGDDADDDSDTESEAGSDGGYDADSEYTKE